jgi:hypothetical protein
MGGIDVALDALEPVAVYRNTCGHYVVWRELVENKIREWGLLLRRTHISPEHPGGLDDGIGFGADLVFKIAPRRVRRRGDACAMDIKGKAMIDTRQPALVINSIIEGRATMGAASSSKPTSPMVSLKEFNPYRRTIRLREFRGQQKRVPIASQ